MQNVILNGVSYGTNLFQVMTAKKLCQINQNSMLQNVSQISDIA